MVILTEPSKSSRWIADLYNMGSSKIKMKNSPKKRRHGIGFFCLTLSDISADFIGLNGKENIGVIRIMVFEL